MDTFGIDYIEGGWPGSNPRDIEFFDLIRKETLRHSKIASFGSTRRAGLTVEKDPQIRQLIEAESPVVTIFGKAWLLHVKEVLKTTPEENLNMIMESVSYLKTFDREVIYDAEHYFDGYKDNTDFALSTLKAAIDGGADFLVLCDTNGGCQLQEFEDIVKSTIRSFPKISSAVSCAKAVASGSLIVGGNPPVTVNAAVAPDASAVRSAILPISSGMRARVSGSSVRMVPLMTTVSGMTFTAVPPWMVPTVITADARGSSILPRICWMPSTICVLAKAIFRASIR